MAQSGVYYDDALPTPWSRRSDCAECGASNPADAPCCWRCGGALEVDDA